MNNYLINSLVVAASFSLLCSCNSSSSGSDSASESGSSVSGSSSDLSYTFTSKLYRTEGFVNGHFSYCETDYEYSGIINTRAEIHSATPDSSGNITSDISCSDSDPVNTYRESVRVSDNHYQESWYDSNGAVSICKEFFYNDQQMPVKVLQHMGPNGCDSEGNIYFVTEMDYQSGVYILSEKIYFEPGPDNIFGNGDDHAINIELEYMYSEDGKPLTLDSHYYNPEPVADVRLHGEFIYDGHDLPQRYIEKHKDSGQLFSFEHYEYSGSVLKKRTHYVRGDGGVPMEDDVSMILFYNEDQ